MTKAWKMRRRMRRELRRAGFACHQHGRWQEVWDDEHRQVVLTRLGRKQGSLVEAEISQYAGRTISLVYDDPLELRRRLA